ncbi:hypothetical protein B0H13DRAFT_2676759 [Mycena leptocephala]|nr:hypothetical protein B0H13DRAFT_2676759 [Mycena leptocephala]
MAWLWRTSTIEHQAATKRTACSRDLYAILVSFWLESANSRLECSPQQRSAPRLSASLPTTRRRVLAGLAGDVVGHAACVKLLRGDPLSERVVISSKKPKEGKNDERNRNEELLVELARRFAAHASFGATPLPHPGQPLSPHTRIWGEPLRRTLCAGSTRFYLHLVLCIRDVIIFWSHDTTLGSGCSQPAPSPSLHAFLCRELLDIRLCVIFFSTLDRQYTLTMLNMLAALRQVNSALSVHVPSLFHCTVNPSVSKIIDYIVSPGSTHVAAVRHLALKPIPNSANSAPNLAKVFGTVESTLERLEVQVHYSSLAPDRRRPPVPSAAVMIRLRL